MIEIRQAASGDIRGVVSDEAEALICIKYLDASLFKWTGLVDKEVACIWGLVAPSILSDSAYLWLITTPVIDDHKFTFIRHSQMIMKGMLEDFPLITGHVIAGHIRSKRWLQWLGVTFKPPIVCRDGEIKLIPFELRRILRG